LGHHRVVGRSEALGTRFGWTVPWLVAGFAMVVYVRTLLPAGAFGDWGEMQAVPHVLGIAHPTGYPTYLILAWLAELVPLGSVAFRANLLSAVFIAATLATFTLICRRLGVRPVLAVATALALGGIGTVWAAATVAEVNPLHLLFAALILHRALVWQDRREPRDLLLGGLLIGLSLGNHLLTLFIAPFVALFVLWAGRHEFRRRPMLLGLAVAGVLVGLLVYLYIPIASAFSPPLDYNHPRTLAGFLFLVTGEQFRGQFEFLSAAGPGEFVRFLPTLWATALSRGTAVVPILGLLGLLVLLWRRPAFGLLCVALLVAGLYVWANYLRLEHYLLVPWLIVAVGTAVAFEAIARVLEAALRRALGRSADGSRAVVARFAGGVTVSVSAVALAIGVGVLDWSASDRSADRSAAAYTDAVFTALPPNAAILVWWDAASPLWYGQLVEGRRPDVLIVDDSNIVYEGWGTREARIASLICQRPVFTLRLNDGDLAPTAELYQVAPFLTVPAAFGGPTASGTRTIYRVEPPDPATCGA
jgi:hypothetical protein